MAAQLVKRRADGNLEAIAIKEKPWMNGSTLHVKFLGGTSGERDKVREQAGWWTDAANLRFMFDDAPNAESALHSIRPMVRGPMSARTAKRSPRMSLR